MVSSLLAELRGPRPSRKARNPKRKTLVESFANLVHLRKFSHPTWRCPPWFRRKFRLSKSYHLLFAACICSFVALFFALLFRCFRENNMEEPIALTLTRKCVKTYQLLNLESNNWNPGQGDLFTCVFCLVLPYKFKWTKTMISINIRHVGKSNHAQTMFGCMKPLTTVLFLLVPETAAEPTAITTQTFPIFLTLRSSPDNEYQALVKAAPWSRLFFIFFCEGICLGCSFLLFVLFGCECERLRIRGESGSKDGGVEERTMSYSQMCFWDWMMVSSWLVFHEMSCFMMLRFTRCYQWQNKTNLTWFISLCVCVCPCFFSSNQCHCSKLTQKLRNANESHVLFIAFDLAFWYQDTGHFIDSCQHQQTMHQKS